MQKTVVTITLKKESLNIGTGHCTHILKTFAKNAEELGHKIMNTFFSRDRLLKQRYRFVQNNLVYFLLNPLEMEMCSVITDPP